MLQLQINYQILITVGSAGDYCINKQNNIEMKSKIKNPSPIDRKEKFKGGQLKAITDILSPDFADSNVPLPNPSFIKNKKQPINHQQGENSLKRIKSDPKLLLSNSYIKLKDIEHSNIQEAIEQLAHRQSGSTKLKSARSLGSLFDEEDALNTEKKKPKFVRKSPKYEDQKIKTKKTVTDKDSTNPKQLLLKQRQLETIKGEVELMRKALQTKNKKIRDYQKMIISIKKQTSDKIKKLEKKLMEKDQEINTKDLQIIALKKQYGNINIQNQQLQKKVQELISEPQILKQREVELSIGENESLSFEMTSTSDNICIFNEYQQQLYRKNLQIYELKQIIEKMKIKEHFQKIKHEEIIKKINEEYQKKCKNLKVTLKGKGSRTCPVNEPIRMKRNQEAQSSMELSLSPEN